MKSDCISIDNRSKGFERAIEETKRVAASRRLDPKDTLRLQVITEEMLSLARSVTGEMEADFWIEGEGTEYEFHMTTRTVMDQEKRTLLLSSATSRKNEAAKGLLGKLRDAFEKAIAAPFGQSSKGIPGDVMSDVVYESVDDPEWDGYERSVLRRLADEVKISIRGRTVEMIVIKRFAA